MPFSKQIMDGIEDSGTKSASNSANARANANKRKKKNNRKRSNASTINVSTSTSQSTSNIVKQKNNESVNSKTTTTTVIASQSVKVSPVAGKPNSIGSQVAVAAKVTPANKSTTTISKANSQSPESSLPNTVKVNGALTVDNCPAAEIVTAASINTSTAQVSSVCMSKSPCKTTKKSCGATNATSKNSTSDEVIDQSLSGVKSDSESSLVSRQSSTDQTMDENGCKTNGKSFGQNVGGDSSLCKICAKHVYHMEQIKAVQAVFHKSCFRCKECNKQLSVDTYSSHAGIIYCKPHFKQLFQPKAVFESEDSKQNKSRKYELIICENTPQELPADVVRSGAKQDDVFENINLDLSNIRNRFESGADKNSNGVANNNNKNKEKPITRSESIHKIMQKYQNRVAGDKDTNSSSDEEDNHPEVANEKEQEKIAFSGMSALKSQWESGTIKANSKSESRVEEELAELRQKVKSSEPLKQVYERAVQEAKSVENLSAKSEPIVHLDSSVKAGSIKEKFEKGKVDMETDEDRVERLRKEREQEIIRIAESETSTKEARNKFKQIEANMGTDKPTASSLGNGHSEDISISPNELQQRFKYFEGLKESNVPPGKENATDEVDDIPKVDTTKKMLDKFKALEAGQSNGELNNANGAVKQPRRITPPRESAPKVFENEPVVERDPNIVRSSYKTEDDIQVEPEKAKNLRAKFENWQTEIERENKKNYEEEDEYVPHIDTTKNLRAMFESINDEYKPVEKPRPRVNRFVQENKAPVGEQCYVCNSRLYPMEKMEYSGIKIHKNCFRCNKCHTPLRLDNSTRQAEKLFCIPHFKQLFMEKGNYDEGFGLEQHKDKWVHKNSNEPNTLNGTVDKVTDNGTSSKVINGNGVHDSEDYLAYEQSLHQDEEEEEDESLPLNGHSNHHDDHSDHLTDDHSVELVDYLS